MRTSKPSRAVESYLAGLPQGLSSHPGCVTKASLLRIMCDGLPASFRPDFIPQDVRQLVVEPPPVSSWISEVHINVVSLSVLDQCFDDEAGWLAWNRGLLQKLMQSPLYRVLFALVSPRRLTQGADKRWAAVRKGVARESYDLTDAGFRVRFDYPEGLFDDRLIEAQVLALQVAYRQTQARQAVARLERFTPTQAHVRVDYRLGSGVVEPERARAAPGL